MPAGWDDFYGFQTVAFFGTAVMSNGKSIVYPNSSYQTDIIRDISVDFLRHRWNKSKPFFMFVTPHAPHSPYTPAPRHAGTLSGLRQPPNPSFNMDSTLQSKLPGDLAKLPEVNASFMNAIFEMRAESLLAVDEMIAALLDEIEAQGVRNDTFVIFSADK